MRKQKTPFDGWPRDPASHFKLNFFAAVSHLLHLLRQSFGPSDEVLTQFPFLSGYSRELADYEPSGADGRTAAEWWRKLLSAWEAPANKHLPLRALRQSCELDHEAMTLLFTIGLIEEDGRFGFLFESLHGRAGLQRPTAGLLTSLSQSSHPNSDVRRILRRLEDLGLIRCTNKESPRTEWIVEVPSILWDVMRGDELPQSATWAQFQPVEDLCLPGDLILPPEVRSQIEALPGVLATGVVRSLILRGPERNGRRTLLGAIARQTGRGLLQISLPHSQDDRWPLVGPLSTLLNAMPALVLSIPPGESQDVSPLHGYQGPIGFALGKQGGLSGPDVEGAITISLDIPDVSLRGEHWREALGNKAPRELALICERFRLTGGNIRRAAKLAIASATVAGRSAITLEDVQQASRALNRQTLDSLASQVPSSGDWNSLAVKTQTLNELRNLEIRCSQREQLHGSVGGMLGEQMNHGVRALFTGPSGTGKTLAARVLSAVLQKDLYRLDLSTVVNKYIGETEKNLSRIFARAEELDVILLLDEGDALLTRRTDVNTANDRYANLETNYLLQRLETFEGILIVTTNAGDRIDRAFSRRMDIVISFPTPDVQERWNIWQLHLPETHSVQYALLEEVAQRCEMTGGQIRNAILHASLMALNNGGTLNSLHLEAAVQREYLKSGAVCPLRSYQSNAVAASRW
ncbi:MAG TPA: ATP-binding protein [Pyrinomonadaceae bacterium]|nr:ATP-binding protein [Pyrinomonadaceae bacterium]